jgi:hypothetical protein
VSDDDMPVDEEHFDSIPWSALIPQTHDRPWLVYVAAGAVVALVVGVLAARSLRPASPAAGPAAETSTTVQPSAALVTPTTVLSISEADLRAEIEPAEGGRTAAAARAEWFVTDYYTRDGAGGREAELAGALGRPAPPAVGEATTYVEWARAWETASEGDGRFRVLVAFRSITNTDTGFMRGLVRGVAVRVQVDATGGTRVMEVPEPVELPAAPAPADLPGPETVPVDVSEQALESALGWGEAASVLEGIHGNGIWRVHVDVADEFGTVWPMVVWVDDSGHAPQTP